MSRPPALRLAIDIGGTFTDMVLVDGTGRTLATAKTATTSEDPSRGALAGAEAVLAGARTPWSAITGMVHGTTLATNALIERRGARVASITTQGFRDILAIGYERRYSQYALDIETPDLILGRGDALTIAGRMDARGRELAPLDLAAVPALAETLAARGVEALAICLMHAYANPAHEQQLAEALRHLLPDLRLSLSHEVSPEAREFDRLCTTLANAYVQPLMARYLAQLAERFAAAGLRCPILMMTAGGGMTTLETAAALPIRLVESGPAGGAILAARLAADLGEDAVLSFDMGGTTAKLCLIDKARPQTARNFEIARAARFIKGSGMPVRIPVIEMIEIGAGGGSLARIDGLGRLRIGPESAGAEPGPVAFGKGGTVPTVTDADLAQGLIASEGFAEGRLALDPDAARDAIGLQIGAPMGLEADMAALGLSEIVDESMASAARMHGVESGKDLGTRVMIAFGGNGPLHATRVARRAGVRRIVIPAAPGVGSALGFLYAPVSFELVRSLYTTLSDFRLSEVAALRMAMAREAAAHVRAGAPGAELSEQHRAFARYRGQGHEIELALPEAPLTEADLPALRHAFEAEYSRQFSRPVPAMEIEILNWAVTVCAPAPEATRRRTMTARQSPAPDATRSILCDLSGTRRDVPVFHRENRSPGDHIPGPALITEPQTTTLVSADFDAMVDGMGNIVMTRRDAP